VSDEQATGPRGDLEPYVAVLMTDGAGWDARELCGRAIVSLARASMWTLAVKTEKRAVDMSLLMRRIELDEQAHELADRYRTTGDRQRLLADLTEHVAAMEALLDQLS
jgi:hypothetical protein